MVFELRDVHIVCLLKAVTPTWVTNTVPFTIAVNYIRYPNSFEILQAKVEVYYRSGPRVRSRVP